MIPSKVPILLGLRHNPHRGPYTLWLFCPPGLERSGNTRREDALIGCARSAVMRSRRQRMCRRMQRSRRVPLLRGDAPVCTSEQCKKQKDSRGEKNGAEMLRCAHEYLIRMDGALRIRKHLGGGESRTSETTDRNAERSSRGSYNRARIAVECTDN